MKKKALLKKLLLLTFLIGINLPLQAETHTIQFGGSFGENYSPASLNVRVGDIIIWQGNFSFHPMSSTSIPAGADSWSVNSGSEFQYEVKVAGDYDYICDFHSANGMIGSFTAESATSVDRKLSSGPAVFHLEQNYPNPFNPETKIVFSIPEYGNVRLSIFNILGKEIAVLVNENREAGKYEVSFNSAGYNLTSGIYVYQLRHGNKLETKKFTLLK